MGDHIRRDDRTSRARWHRYVVPVAVALFLSACGDGSGDPSPGPGPETTINGKVAPGADGNNRDQPITTSPQAPSP
jgi:hypothetical protein